MLALTHRTAIVGMLCIVVTLAGCREDEEGLTVAAIHFKGARAFTSSELEKVLGTEESGRFPWSRKHYFDRATFEADLERLRLFYSENGYPDARVVSFDAHVQGDEAITLVVTLDEGQPVTVDHVEWKGFDVISADRFSSLRSRAPLRAGAVRRQALAIATKDMAVRVLQDQGFAHAQVRATEVPGPRAGRVVWEFEAQPGPPSFFGPITVEGNKAVGDDIIRRELTFEPGKAFNLRDIHESQRRLYALDLFLYANVEPRTAEAGPEIPVRVTVAEDKPRQLRGSVGYGSEEKLRGEIGWEHKNFLGGARAAGVDAKWSSLDRGLRASFEQPYFLGARQTLGVTAERWYFDEPVYTLDTTGMRVTVTRERNRRDPVTRRGAATRLSVSGIYELERYRISDAALLDPSLRNDLIALGLDPRTGRNDGTLVALALDARRDTTNNLLNARRGYVVSAHLEQAGMWMPGDFNYVELSGEARHYWQVGTRVIVANRVRLGGIASRGPGEQVPFFKRYFLGGSTSLRGWGRYEVAPLSAGGQPLGGLSFLELSSEVRIPLFGKLGAVGFVDAGNVWPRSWRVHPGDLEVDVGPGLRYDTPVGPFRIDLGYQLTPITDLTINGKPEPRHWRVHFSIGHTF